MRHNLVRGDFLLKGVKGRVVAYFPTPESKNRSSVLFDFGNAKKGGLFSEDLWEHFSKTPIVDLTPNEGSSQFFSVLPAMRCDFEIAVSEYKKDFPMDAVELILGSISDLIPGLSISNLTIRKNAKCNKHLVILPAAWKSRN